MQITVILTSWKVNLSNSRTWLEIRLNKKELIMRVIKIYPDSQCCTKNYMLSSVTIRISSLFQWKINIRNFQEEGAQGNLGIVMARFTKMPRYILGKLWVFQEIVIPLKYFSISEKVFQYFRKSLVFYPETNLHSFPNCSSKQKPDKSWKKQQYSGNSAKVH